MLKSPDNCKKNISNSEISNGQPNSERFKQ